MTDRIFNILLIEDNDAHAELVMENFKEHDFTHNMHLVQDGAVALDYLYRKNDYADPETSPRPDVILLDLRLPKIDGLDILKRIKNDDGLRAIPVVILTTSDADMDIDRAYELHANSYLVKPVIFKDFKNLMKTLGFYWLTWNKTSSIASKA